MYKGLYFIIIACILISCTNTNEVKDSIPENNTEKKDSIIVSDSIKQLIGQILSYEHNFNLNLVKKIRDKGEIGGLKYCNTKLISKEVHSNFKNVNRFQTIDSTIMSKFKTENLYIPHRNEKTLLYPIVLRESFCLNCHGTPYITVPSKVYTEIRKSFPNTKTGLKQGDIIGYWQFN